jgi:nucleoside-diphosphate-sugar epimerase
MNPLERDLDFILEHTAGIWDEFRGERIFITGGTGFFGCWLLESFLWANERLKLGARATVLTRDPAKFAKKCPHLAESKVLEFVQGDVCERASLPDGKFSHVIHAATDSGAYPAPSPEEMERTILRGTVMALDFATKAVTKKFLLTSSGAIYGSQQGKFGHIRESWRPDSPLSAYAKGKSTAEVMCRVLGESKGFETKIARGFAFVGPYLPLDAHFAIGNFIRDGLRGGPIIVNGDGTPYRSYLYAADLAIWLWTILVRGESGRAYNVGSEHALTIAELADTVASCFTPKPEVRILGTPTPGKPAQRYVPSTQLAQTELQLKERVAVPEAIRRTIDFHRREHAP